MSIRNTILAATAGVTLAVGGVGVAFAAPGAPHAAATTATTSTVYKGCVTGTSRTMEHVYSRTSPPACPLGSFRATWNQQGPRGLPGKNGTNGTNGTNGILNVTSYDLLANETTPDSTMTINAGGSFSAGKTLVDTISLSAGTYLVSVNFKGVALTDGGAGAQITPQLFVYNGAAQSDFSNDLFNAGGGDLQPAATNHDSYYTSGTQIVTVPSGGETLDIYGFGYLDNSGAGTWGLEAGSNVTVVQINPGS